ncbi:uncharacterized protein MYCFIDRAFT_175765 [Pseudocercospora fijiensis CIRAD86]|uniref:Uncharacterized protein n=1 Tax=Pseudocercospora fijiensis (strain CIRAD86) TaxID=383855 RepID=M3AXQ2_PSEFD|nr:uncharacterized protein MYCFIDRAFT_175765 [Pseudocercospora fijiensis CIRAD86]EME82237.1 hypothetical protein MYCFIDRAFT_175765 [Pseudocercospora fijiensis CIRAD86]
MLSCNGRIQLKSRVVGPSLTKMILAAEFQEVECPMYVPIQEIAYRAKTGFFDLPSELRNQIYELAAQDDQSSTTRRRFIIPGCSEIPAFANTCRQIRQEYLAFWIEGRTLEIHLNLPLREPEVEKELHRWMLTVGRAAVPFCKSFLLGGIRVQLDPDHFVAHQAFNSNMKRVADEIVRILKAKGEKPRLTAKEIEFVRSLYGEKELKGPDGEKEVRNSKGQFVGWVKNALVTSVHEQRRKAGGLFQVDSRVCRVIRKQHRLACRISAIHFSYPPARAHIRVFGGGGGPSRHAGLL